jgi:hypothetical protein
MNAADAKRLKDLERENATLKRLLADAELEKAAARRFPGETSEPGTAATGRRTTTTAGARLPGAGCLCCSTHPPVSDSH